MAFNRFHRGFHHRGTLPHVDIADTQHAITYRLADSLPSPILVRILQETIDDERKRRRMIEHCLDRGYGSSLLNNDVAARIVVDNWKHFDGSRYRLHGWVVMPNHVHVLIHVHAGQPLARIVESWKSYTANAINRALGRIGRFWQSDYWDRFIRDEAHFVTAMRYIHENPVKAGLVGRPQQWQWSSAYDASAAWQAAAPGRPSRPLPQGPLPHAQRSQEPQEPRQEA